MRTSIANQEYRLPLVVSPEEPASPEDLIAWWNGNQQWVDDKLHDHGVLLFRGFGIADQEVLQHLVQSVSGGLMNYVDGNSPRTKVSSGVYTSTEYPPEFFISMHNELSYSAQWPARLFFCCAIPPREGGETPLIDSRRLLRELPDEVSDPFRERGVTYIRNLHAGQGFGPSWMDTFETEERADVEEHAERNGMSIEWMDDGSVRLSNTRPATMKHPVTGEEVWFNQADQFHPSTHPAEVYDSMMALYKGREESMPQFVTFGDGSEIPEEMLDTIRSVTEEHLVLEPWQKGDLVLVDNMLAAHGRMPFKGPRKILVSMSQFLAAEDVASPSSN